MSTKHKKGRAPKPQPALERPVESDEVLAAAYALGQLDEEEIEGLEARLFTGDPRLEAQLAQALETLADLAMTLKPVPLPPSAKLRLMAQLEGARTGPDVLPLLEPNPAPPLGAHTPNPGLEADRVKLDALTQNLARHMAQPPPLPVPGRRALLIVDMLHDYVDEGSPMEMPLARAIVPALERRIVEERARGTAIFYVNDYHVPNDPDFAVWPVHAVQGTRGAQVIPQLAPRPEDRFVDRLSYSAFFATDLEAELQELGITELVLAGQAADICVMMTAVDGLMRGFRVEVPEESVAGTTEEGKAFALRRIALLQPYQARKR